MRKLIVSILVTVFCSASFAEDEPKISLTVLPTSDTSELGLAEPLQYALGQVLQSTGVLSVQLSGYSLPGFTTIEIEKAFDSLKSDLLSFSYMEKNRISVFLFSKDRTKEFIVSFRMLDDAPDGQLTSEFIETRFREAVNDVLTSYNSGTFQPLPGSENQTAALDDGEQKQRASEARILFRELASLEERHWYLGANIGLARYSETTTTQTVANSTVDFGTYCGRRLSERFAAEAGIDVFSYLLLHSDVRYHIPFLDKYVNLSVTGGVGKILVAVTENQRSASTTSIVGSMGFGPGVGFDIPLLGATVRGEMRYYIGSTSFLVGTYGIILAL